VRFAQWDELQVGCRLAPALDLASWHASSTQECNICDVGHLHGQKRSKACWSMQYPSQQQPVAAGKHAFLAQGLHVASRAPAHAFHSLAIPFFVSAHVFVTLCSTAAACWVCPLRTHLLDGVSAAPKVVIGPQLHCRLAWQWRCTRMTCGGRAWRSGQRQQACTFTFQVRKITWHRAQQQQQQHQQQQQAYEDNTCPTASYF
jgi:hypothetical protein